MRVDGSIKSVTAGISTLDDKRHDGTFAQIVDNFRCDPYKGLIKRPASRFLQDLLPDFDPLLDVIVPVIIQDALYWLYIQPTADSQNVRIFDVAGNESPVETTIPTSYFSSLTGITSFAYVAIGNAIYVGNKNVEVKRADLRDIRNRSSMIVVKQAPAPYSKIDIQWTASDGNMYEIPTIPVGDENVDRGTNTIAIAIRDAINTILTAESIPDNIYVQGSTVLYQRADGEFASITGTDGARDAVIATINANTPDINNLGKYAGADCVVQIKPDPTSDRGSYYMRANPEIETDTDPTRAISAVAFTLTCGEADVVGPFGTVYLYVRGFADPDGGGIGSITPPTWKGHTVLNMIQYLNPDDSTDNVPFQFTVSGTGIFNPSILDYMWLIDTDSGEVHTATTMEVLGWEQEGLTWAAVWAGNGGQLWEDGQTFEVHDEYSDAIYGKLPEVRWEEAADPDALNYIDSVTMPHVLGLRNNGTWAFGPQTEGLGIPKVQGLRPRQAGDNDTNPFPEFLDNTVNDLGRFQDRLVILSGDTVSMSVTDKAHGWFRETATQQLAIDPIGLKSSSQNALSLNYIVSHNNDALLFSRNAQYKLVGSQGMTSQNAALPQTTNYDNNLSVKPVSNASDVFFAISYSVGFSGVSRFQVDSDSDSQDIANPVTNHVQELLAGDILLMTASSTLNMVLAVTRVTPNIIYVYEYVDSRTDPQMAWTRWIFPEGTRILNIAMTENLIQMVIKGTNDRVALYLMRLNQSVTTGMHRVIYLDDLVTQDTVTTSFELPSNYPFDDDLMELYQGEGCPNPGALITGWTRSGTTITLPVSMEGGGVAAGFPFQSTYMPARKWVRDPSGIPQTASQLRITDWGFHAYGNDIHVDIVNAPESWPTQVFTNTDPDNDAYHRISFKQRHDEADIEIKSDDPFDLEILQLEWRGTYYKTGRRF